MLNCVVSFPILRFTRQVQFESIMNENSDEEEFEINVPTTESAAQKQQSDGGSTVQSDSFADRDEARIFELISKLIRNVSKLLQFLLLDVLLRLTNSLPCERSYRAE